METNKPSIISLEGYKPYGKPLRISEPMLIKYHLYHISEEIREKNNEIQKTIFWYYWIFPHT